MLRRDLLTAALTLSALSVLPSASRSRTSLAHDRPRLITGFNGRTPEDPEVQILRGYLEHGLVAGCLLLSRNIVSPEQLTRLTASLRAACPGGDPIVAIDQEGGFVARLGPANGFLPWASAAEIAAAGLNDGDLLDYYRPRAGELAAVGITLNLGPVVDLNINPDNPIIGARGRAFGRDPDTVTRHAHGFIAAHRAAGVETCLKHFPGHGSSQTDSHVATANVIDTWRAVELEPFYRLIDSGFADSVMTGHLLHRDLSDRPWIPASLSRKSVAALRSGFGFAGPIITDDMQMAAVTQVMSAPEAAVAAVAAGHSHLIYSQYRKGTSLRDMPEIATAIDSALVPDTPSGGGHLGGILRLP